MVRASVLIVGGGASGALLALHIARLRPDMPVALIDDGEIAGQGIAYGRCSATDCLNVPAARLNVGLSPSFQEFCGAAGNDFALRQTFGAYLASLLTAACLQSNLAIVRGRVRAVMPGPMRGVVLEDERVLEADRIVLALGNPPPASPLPWDAPVLRSPFYVADPWRRRSPPPDGDIVLIGAGLTMVDVASALMQSARTGTIYAYSRRGLLPQPHVMGGDWAPFVDAALPLTPLEAFRLVRAQVVAATAQGVPWQRVMDAVRPATGKLWRSWSAAQQAQFLRHARTVWDTHRHRMPPQVAPDITQAIADNRLVVLAARLQRADVAADHAEIHLRLRGPRGDTMRIRAAQVINCTGPDTDFARSRSGLVADLLQRALICPDALRLGIQTADCAVVQADGVASSWLFALGPLTRPAWWEITAIPEIAAQARRLAEQLCGMSDAGPATSLEDAFVDLGAGI